MCLFIVVVGNGKESPAFPETIPGSVLALLGISASSYLVSKGIQFSDEDGVKDRPPRVYISPKSARLSPGGSQTFSSRVEGTDQQQVRWSIAPDIGAIDQNGKYTAPAKLSQQVIHVQIIATSVQDPNGEAHAQLLLGDPSAPDPSGVRQPVGDAAAGQGGAHGS